MIFDHDALKRGISTEKAMILWALLPEIKCPEDCSMCCDIGLGISMQHRSGLIDWVFTGSENRCGAKNEEDKCSKYETRPTICRVFFKSEDGLKCFRGLEPVGGRISKEQMRRILWCAELGTVQDAKAIRAEYLKKGE